MVKIDENLSYNNNFYPEQNTREYITIHETANTGVGANAEAHANFINNGSMETWHYTVDDKHAIKHYYHTTSCWAAGTYNGNTKSINIEMAINSDGDYLKTLMNTIELVQKIQKEENIPTSKVVQHFYWSGKNCPTLLREGTHGMTWDAFKKQIDRQKPQNNTKKSKTKKSDWEKNQYGTYYKEEKGVFTVGSEPIYTYLGSPFTSVESGGQVVPNQKVNYYMVAIQDGYVWIETDDGGRVEFIPVRTCTGTPPNHTMGKLWGVIK